MSHVLGLSLVILVLVILGLYALGVPLPLPELLRFVEHVLKEAAIVAIVLGGIAAVVWLARLGS